MASPISRAPHKFRTLTIPQVLDTAKTIRRAERKDAWDIAAIFDKAFGGRYRYFWRLQAKEGEDALIFFVREVERDDIYLSWRNVIVVEYHGKVCAFLLGLNEVQESWGTANPALCEDENALLALELRAHTLTGKSDVPCTWFISYIAVLPEMQGKGMGTVLLAAALEEAKACGKTQASLVVRENAAGPRGLYEGRFGFKEIERAPVHKSQWKINADNWVILRKELESTA